MDTSIFLKKSKLDYRFVNDDRVLLAEAREGVSPTVAEYLAELSGATKTNLEKVLPQTFKNMKRKRKLETVTSERILMISRVFLKGLEIFDTSAKLLSWLNKFNPYLQSIPFDMLNTTTGCIAVYNELIRIEEGILA